MDPNTKIVTLVILLGVLEFALGFAAGVIFQFSREIKHILKR